MPTEIIDETPRYIYERVLGPPGETFQDLSAYVRTFYIHQGSASVNFIDKNLGAKVTHNLQAGTGFIATPAMQYHLTANQGLVALQTTSYVPEHLRHSPIIEIIDDEQGKREAPISDLKIITNPKKVVKPWGHELWISWLRDYHVLKQIGMTAGQKSSLQLHRQKLETNYLVSGQAEVIDGYQMLLDLSEEQMKARVKDLDWTAYTQRKTPGMHWTSVPGIVHRVISRESYIAYETSTPELDDVVRLSDVSGRQSGRIESEHKA